MMSFKELPTVFHTRSEKAMFQVNARDTFADKYCKLTPGRNYVFTNQL